MESEFEIHSLEENKWKLQKKENKKKIIYLNEQYYKFWRKIKNNENFVFYRFDDDIRENRQQDSFKYLCSGEWKKDKKIFWGIPCPCCNSFAYYWYISQIQSCNVTFEGLWKNSKTFYDDFMSLERDIVIISNKKTGDYCFKKPNILKKIIVEENIVTWKKQEEIFIQEVFQGIECKKDLLFVVSAGEISNFIIDKLYQYNQDNCYISFDEALFSHKIDKKYSYKSECWMFRPEYTKFDVSVVLNMYKRPDMLKQQIEAIQKQSLVPKKIFLNKDGIDSYYSIELDEEILKELDDLCISDGNEGVWHRFEYASEIVKSTYVCLLDDDTIPGEQWLENCHMHMQQQEAVYGANGILLEKDNNYPLSGIRIGWVNPNEVPMKVDFVGHAWFIKTEWLQWMMEGHEFYKHRYKYVGEDMYLSYKCWEKGIPTYVPPHKISSSRMWGSLPYFGSAYGSSAAGISHNYNNLESMRRVLVELCAAGWKPFFCTDNEYCQRVYKEYKDLAMKRKCIKEDFLKNWEKERKVYFYGAGKYAKILSNFANKNGKKIEKYVVSEITQKNEDDTIIGVDEFLSYKKENLIILALDEIYHAEIRENLRGNTIIEVYPPNCYEATYPYRELIELAQNEEQGV